MTNKERDFELLECGVLLKKSADKAYRAVANICDAEDAFREAINTTDKRLMLDASSGMEENAINLGMATTEIAMIARRIRKAMEDVENPEE